MRHLDNPRLGCFHKKILKEELASIKQTTIVNQTTINNVNNGTATINVNKGPKNIKRHVNGDTKRVVACNQDWKCNHCKEKLPANYETDHIIPLFRGGTNEKANLQALCNNCHAQKSIMERCF